MDWKLILQLSLFGLAMGIATVFVIPQNVEPAFWLVIFLICAYVVAKARPTGRFALGLLFGLGQFGVDHWRASGVLRPLRGRTRARSGDAEERAGFAEADDGTDGAGGGLVSGVVIGLLALAAGKLIKQPMSDAKRTTA